MTALEALKNIKAAIKQHFGDEEAVKFEAGKLKDGTAIEYSVLEAGGDISVVAADGTKTPAPAGDHILEDGRIIVVTDAGKIAEVKEAPAEEQKMADEPKGEEAKTAGGIDWSQEVKYLKDQLAYMAKQIATLTTAQQMFKDQTGGVLTSMSELLETVASEGKANPITTPKQTLLTENTKTKQSAFERAQAAIKKYNENQLKQEKK